MTHAHGNRGDRRYFKATAEADPTRASTDVDAGIDHHRSCFRGREVDDVTIFHGPGQVDELSRPRAARIQLRDQLRRGRSSVGSSAGAGAARRSRLGASGGRPIPTRARCATGPGLGQRRGKTRRRYRLARRLARILYAMWRDETDHGGREFDRGELPRARRGAVFSRVVKMGT